MEQNVGFLTFFSFQRRSFFLHNTPSILNFLFLFFRVENMLCLISLFLLRLAFPFFLKKKMSVVIGANSILVTMKLYPPDI